MNKCLTESLSDELQEVANRGSKAAQVFDGEMFTDVIGKIQSELLGSGSSFNEKIKNHEKEIFMTNTKKVISLGAVAFCLWSANANAIAQAFVCWSCSPNGVWECSAADKEGNLAVVDQVVGDLLANELKGANKFEARVKSISGMSPEERIKAYYALANIEGDKELPEFVGFGDKMIAEKHVNALMVNGGLTKQQAEGALQKLSTAFMGERQE